jgi:hypothetical protein
VRAAEIAVAAAAVAGFISDRELPVADARKKALLIRIPQDLWEALNRWAADELRSVNAQIEYVLRDGLRRRVGQEFTPPMNAPEDQPAQEEEAPADRDLPADEDKPSC